MIEFRQKDFARITKYSDILNDAELSYIVPTEFINAIEMYDLEGGKYVNHWIIEKIVNNLFSIGTKFGIYPQQFLAASFEDNLNSLEKVFGTNSVNKFRKRFQTPEIFIETIKRDILSSSKRSIVEPKYDKIFRNRNPKFIYTNEEYIKIFKFLALCLSGQVPEADWDRYWEIGNKYVSILDVNYNTVHNTSDSYICKIISTVFRGITGSNILKDYEE